MRVNVTATKRINARPHLNYVADRMAEVLPAVTAYRETTDEQARLFLDARLGELEHACRIARKAL